MTRMEPVHLMQVVNFHDGTHYRTRHFARPLGRLMSVSRLSFRFHSCRRAPEQTTTSCLALDGLPGTFRVISTVGVSMYSASLHMRHVETEAASAVCHAVRVPAPMPSPWSPGAVIPRGYTYNALLIYNHLDCIIHYAPASSCRESRHVDKTPHALWHRPFNHRVVMMVEAANTQGPASERRAAVHSTSSNKDPTT